MAVSGQSAQLSLQIRRSFRHPREKVYEAWIDPKEVTRWFAPSDEYTVVVPTLEPRVGGRYVIEMRHSSGRVSTVIGTYRTLERPSKLVFTWMWENDPDRGPETLVTVELFERGQETELVLTHERFTNEDLRERHNQGWIGCLNQLENAL
jgi:uncharacterized protein YndB with AHSA1/START domain